MAITLIKVALVWVTICTVLTYSVSGECVESTNPTRCIFEGTKDPVKNNLYITIFEEISIGNTVYEIVVDPPGSTLTWTCTETTNVLSPCYYLTLDGTNVTQSETFNIENSTVIGGAIPVNKVIIYGDPSKDLPYITCKPPGSGRSENCINALTQFQNLNEPAELNSVYNADVFELSPFGTTVLFNTPVIAMDPDVIKSDEDYGNFTCQLIDLNIPFSVSCTTTNDYTLQQAWAEATITVTGLLDYEAGPTSYDLTLRVTDTTDNVVNSPLSVDTVLHVEVVDLDDLNPAFDYTSYESSIQEGGTRVLDVSPEDVNAYDQDLAFDEPVEYTFDDETQSYLTIDPTTAEIEVVSPFDRETINSYTINIVATQMYNTARFATVPFTLNITDINDNCPSFDSTMYQGQVSRDDFYVTDNAGERLVIFARDADAVFEMTSLTLGQTGNVFELEIVTEGPEYLEVNVRLLEPENLNSDGTPHELTMQLIDANTVPGPCSVDTAITVSVVISGNPVFDEANYLGDTDENVSIGTEILVVTATNSDGTSGGIVYRIKSATNNGQFVIDQNGAITVNGAIDYEEYTDYVLVVEAQDRRTYPTRSTSASVTITVNDLNDKCPEFTAPLIYNGQVSSQDVYVVDSNSVKLMLIATDEDQDYFAEYEVKDPTSAGFDVEQVSINGENLYYVTIQDFSALIEGQSYEIQVSLTDSSQPSCTASSVLVNVTATNLSPNFDQKEYPASVDEGSDVGTFIVMVSAETFDGITDVVYSIRSSSDDGMNKFEIDGTSGEILVKDGTINAEDVAAYTLVVEAQDRRWDPIRSATAAVFIEIVDVNDECPGFVSSSVTGVISSHDVYVVTSDSQRLILSASDADISRFTGTTDVTDDSGAGFSVEIAPSSAGNMQDYYIKVGDFSKLVPDVTYIIQVSLTDPSQPLCSASIATVNITATNLSPNFDPKEYTESVDEDSDVGTSVVTVSAETFDGITDVVYSIRSSSDDGMNKFEIDGTSGEILVKDDTINAEDVAAYTLVVEAQDRRWDPIRSATAAVFIEIVDVNDECPGFVSSSVTGVISSHDVYVVTSDSQRLILSASDADISRFTGTTDVTDDSGAGFSVEIAPSSAGNMQDYYIKVGDFSKLVPDVTYIIQVSLTDPSQPLCSASIATVNITATNLSPNFDPKEYTESVDEDSDVGTSVVTVSAETFDGITDVVYSIRSSSDDGMNKFEIDGTSGEILVKDDTINAEDVAAYTLVVEAQDRRWDPIRSATAAVFIEIVDVNDECPGFVSSSVTGVISSHDVYVVTSDSQRLILSASDADISRFTGTTDVTDDSGAGFSVEIAPSSAGNMQDYYIKVTDFSKLVSDVTYIIQVSLTDPSQPLCSASIATVNITATNLSPNFDPKEYTESVDEGSDVGTSVVTVSAETFDGITDVVYSIRSSSDDGMNKFEIDETSGEISVKDDTINAEDVAAYTLVVEAQDRRWDPIRSATATVFIEIVDVNDECPEFVSSSFTGVISSHDVYVVTSDSQRLILSASDADISQFTGTTDVTDDSGAGFSVEIAPSSAGNMQDYYIKVGDFSKLVPDVTYIIQVSLTDPSQPLCSSSVAAVNITATNLSPNFDPKEYTASVDEGSDVGTFVVMVSAETFDGITDVVYSIRSSSDDGMNKFEIDETSGEISVKDDTINAEDVAAYTLVVEAQDRRWDPIRSATATVFIEVVDVNDECPEFVSSSFTGVISSHDVYVVTTSNLRLILSAMDNDDEFIGTISLIDNSGAGFEGEVAPSSVGNLRDYYIKVNDFDQLELDVTYVIEVLLTDIGCTNSVATVKITARDLAPVFNPKEYSPQIVEGDGAGTFVVQVSALNFEGTEEGIVYGIRSATDDGLAIFTMNSTTGEISVKSESTNAEAINEYTLIVEAQDRRLDPIRSSTASVIVTVLDKNDNCPAFEELIYYGNITRQDVFVVDENLEQLIIIAQDPDSEFIGVESFEGNPSFELVQTTPPSEVRSLYLSIKLVNQTGIEDGAVYMLKVSLDDDACAPSIAEVIVTVTDSLAPVFSPPDYEASIMEGDDAGTYVTQVFAYRQDASSHNILYRLKSANNEGSKIFTIDSEDGVISLKSDATNAELVTEYTLVVEAEDRLANPPRASTTIVIVQVGDTNDNCPVFDVKSYNGVITDQDKYVIMAVDNLQRLALVSTDDDIGGFTGSVTQLNLDAIFSLETANSTSPDGDEFLMVYVFLVDPTLLTSTEYTLQVAVIDDSTVSDIVCEVSITNVTIQVVDNLAPVFTQESYNATIDERSPEGTPVVTVEAISRNPGPSQIFYKLTREADKFQINAKTGAITVQQATTDYETQEEHNLVVEAQDRGTEPFRTASVTVTVYITDINDECPSFDSQFYTGQGTLDDRFVLNSGTVDRLILTGMDLDTDFSGSYSIYNDTSDGAFGILPDPSSNSQTLRLNAEVLDSTKLELGQSYQLGVLLTDTTATGTVCSSFTLVTIDVEDFNPSFTRDVYTGAVNEMADVGTFVAMVSATNKDNNSEDIVYIILSVTGDGLDKFAIDDSGNITVSSDPLDAEYMTEYTLFVEAQDVRTEIIRSTTAKVIVTVYDINDNCPEFTNVSYSGLLSSQDAFVVQADMNGRLTLQANDDDVSMFIGNAEVSQDDSGAGFEVVEAIGTAEIGYYIRVTDFTVLLPDTAYNIQVMIQDTGNSYCRGSSTVNVNILALDLSPEFEPSAYFANVTELSPVDTPVKQVSAFNYDGNSMGIVYSLKSSTDNGLNYFKINPDTGAITVKDAAIDWETTSEYALVVEAQDRRLDPIRSASANVFVSINDANDMCPTFVSATYDGEISLEDMYVFAVGTSNQLALVAEDGDSIFEGDASITDGNPSGGFRLEQVMDSDTKRSSWYIQLPDPTNVVDNTEYQLTVTVRDTTSVVNCNTGVETIVRIMVENLSPQFTNEPYSGEVSENDPISTPVTSVSAVDKDGNSANIRYHLTAASDDGMDIFGINDVTGDIFIEVAGLLDADTITKYTLHVEAEDTGLDVPRTAASTVSVTVKDFNDLCPDFDKTDYIGQITPGEPFVTFNGNVLVLTATDGDLVFDGDLSTTGGQYDAILDEEVENRRTYIIESQNIPSPGDAILTVTLTDGTITSCVRTATVRVTAIDESLPYFDPPSYMESIQEKTIIGTNVTTVTAFNGDGNADGMQYFLLSATNGGDAIFDVESDGDIRVKSADTDADGPTTEYTLFVEAQDRRDLSDIKSTTAFVVVGITDINDNPPVCYDDAVDVPEDAPIGRSVLSVQASDDDQSDTLGYSITNPPAEFKIDPGIGLITVSAELDRDPPGTGFYSLEVSVTDGTNTGSCTIDIIILDVNDNAPVFTGEPYELSVNEDQPETGITVTANDIDIDQNAVITFSLPSAPPNITIDPNSGVLTFNGPFDREETSQIVTTVRASDGGMPTLFTTATVTLTILDINDKAPEFDQYSCTFVAISEDVSPGTDIDCTVLAIDGDEPGTVNSEVTYEVQGTDASYFSIIKDVDGYGNLRLIQRLDRENKARLAINILARDNGSPILSNSLDIEIEVVDVNDHPPVFLIAPVRVVYSAPVDPGVNVTSVTPTDEDMYPNDIIMCSLSGSDMFYISSDGLTCTLFTAQRLEFQPDPHILNITAYNPDRPDVIIGASSLEVKVFVTDTSCFVDIGPGDFIIRRAQGDVNTGVPVVDVDATSTCGDSPVFTLENQELSPNPGDPSQPSSNFRIDAATGEIFSLTNNPPTGKHSMTVAAYVASDPDNSKDEVQVEITIVADANNPPKFDAPVYSTTLEAPQYTVPKEVFDLENRVTDDDLGEIGIGELIFTQVATEPDDGLFEVTETGQVLLVMPLIEVTEAYTVNISVNVADKGVPPLSDDALVQIHVELPDPGIYPPIFGPDDCQDISISENLIAGTYVCQVTASSGLGTEITFELIDAGFFTIDTSTGVITTTASLDYEVHQQFQLFVSASNLDGVAYKAVTVDVNDINDNAPQFEQNECINVVLQEDDVLETPVCRVLALDMDEPGTGNSLVTYELSGDNKDKFVIREDGDPGYGMIYLNWSLDPGSYTLTIVARDNGSPILSNTLDIEIEVVDVNDHPPVFLIAPVRVVYELPVDPGVNVTSVTPMDEDMYPNDIIMCSLSGSDMFYVSSDGLTCTLFTAQRLEFQPDPHILNITAYNPDKPDVIIGASSLEVRVYVADSSCFVDIEPGEFIVRKTQGDVNTVVPVVDVDATSTCGDSPVFTIENQELSPNPGDPSQPSSNFRIDPATGQIFSLTNNPPTGKHSMRGISYVASDPDNSKDEVQVEITIVTDANNPPEFDQSVYSIILEAPQYSVPKEVLDLENRVSDDDLGEIGNGELIFTQEATEPDDGLFEVTESGQVLLVRPLIEVTEAYTVNISVKVADKGVPPLSDDALVQIHVELPDPGINPPIFGPDDCQDISIDENLIAGTYVCQVTASSGLGTEITFELIDAGFFTIDTNTGVITTTASLDYEIQQQYQLLVSASNLDGVTYKPVPVDVNDINDNAPRFEQNECINVILQEDDVLETPVCRVLALDMDEPGTGNSLVTYELSGDNKDKFVIREDGDPGYGMIYLNWSLDPGSYTLTIVARDNGSPILSNTLDIEIEVVDVNDHPPVFLIAPVRVVYELPVDPGVNVTSVTPTDEDMYPNDIIMCSLSGSDMFYVASDGLTCTLFTAQRLEFQPDPHMLNITAYNPDRPDVIIGASSLEVRVYVADSSCFVDIEPGEFIVRKTQGDVNTVVPVVDVDATSTCGDSPVFTIENQELSPNPGEPSQPSSNFRIDPATGEIFSLTNNPPTGKHSMRGISYVASDPDNSKDEVQVEITIVTDANNPPEFDQSVYSIILEAPQYSVPKEVLDLENRVSDDDLGEIGNGELIFTQEATEPDDGLFEVTESGQVLLVRPLIEVTEAYTVNINVKVADKGVPPLSDDTLVQIHVELPDPGINPPIFGPDDCQDISIDENLIAGTYVCQVTASSGLGTEITFELIDAGFFTIDTNTGVITTTASLDYEIQQQYQLLVSASNLDGVTYKPVPVDVNDINDNAPRFEQNECINVILQEDDVLETPVCRVLALDMDEPGTGNSLVTYELSGDNKDKFVIREDGDPGYGMIYLNWSLDPGSYTLTIVARDNGSPILSNSLDIEIEVVDVNDHPPVFLIAPVRVVYELPVDPGVNVTSVTPTDEDMYPNDIIMCSLSGSDMFYVASDGLTCTLFTAQRLEFQPDPHMLNITAYNPDRPDVIIGASSLEVRVYVADSSCFVDIEPGEFIVRKTQGDVNTVVPVVDVDATSTCGDSPVFTIENQELSPNPGEPSQPSSNFRIDPATGEIFSLTNNPPTGKHSMRGISYVASDPDNSKDEVQVEITIVTDANNPPEFDQSVYSIILEAPQYSVPKEVLDLENRVSDDDLGEIGNGELIFTQEATEPDDGLFEVTETGQVLLVRPLIEVTEAYTVNINVKVADKGVPPLSDDTLVQIHVELPDPGINPPIFGPDDCQDISIDENLIAGTYVCQVTASSGLGTEITFELIDAGFFTIDTNTGVITTTASLDHEIQQQYQLLVSASNLDGITYKPVTVDVNDINDNAPQFEQNECINVVLQEDDVLETPVCRVLALDMDEPGTGNSLVTYELSGDNKDKFVIREDGDPGYGMIYLNWSLDKEVRSSYTLTIVARDNGSPILSNSLDIEIKVADVNDNPPEFLTPSQRVVYDTPVGPGEKVISVTPEDADDYPYDIIMCSLSGSDMFYVSSNGSMCTLFTAQRLEFQPDPHILNITAYNPDKPDVIIGASSLEVRVYVADSSCFVDIEPGEFIVRKTQGDVNTVVPVVDVDATSTCGESPVFTIENQELSPDPGEPSQPSSNFRIDPATGEIFSLTNNPPTGKHSMRGISYVASDPDNSKDEVKVEITILSDTNNPPEFDQSVYNITIPAPQLNVPIEVLNLENRVTDDDLGEIGIGELIFTQVATEPDDGLFEVTETGQVLLVRPLIEVTEAYTVIINVKVADKGLPPLSDDALVQIHIKLPDSGIYPPIFGPDDCQDINVDEGSSNSEYICQVQATSELGTEITFELMDAGFFTIDPSTGEITTTAPLDYEQQQQYQVLVAASNLDGTTYKPANVNVNDINDNPPQFDLSSYSFTIEEDFASSSCPTRVVGTVHASDLDTEPDYSNIEYILDGAVNNFEIDIRTGTIRTTDCIDRDIEYRNGPAVFNVIAENIDKNPDQTGIVEVTVQIGDVNDNSPIFDPDSYEHIVEFLEDDMYLITVTATDADQDINGDPYYLLDEIQEDEVVFEYFRIEKNTGDVFTRKADFQQEPREFMINVKAFDLGSPSLYDDATVRIIAGNLKDPYFKPDDRSQRLHLIEGDPEACDTFALPLYNDTLGVLYEIVTSTGDFRLQCVDPVTPQLCTNAKLDREKLDIYEVVIRASSTGKPGCSVGFNTAIEYGTEVGIQSNQTILEITVGDVNDETPEFEFEDYMGALGKKYYIGIADNALYGSSVFHIQASDADLNDSLVFTIAAKSMQSPECYGSPEYSIDDTGELIVKDTLFTHLDRPRAQFDQEQAVCDFDITVTDVAAEVSQSQEVDAKIKILLVYEHIIISLDEPPEQVKLEVAGIVSCLADLVTDYVLFVEDVRAYLLEETDDSSLIQPQWTDIWFYAVNVNTKEFAKFWEFRRALYASPGWTLCIPDYLNIRRPSNIRYTEVEYAGYALLAVAGFIGIAGLLAMFALFLSWDRMQADKRRLKQQGRVTLAYKPESVLDRDSVMQPRTSIHSIGSVEKAKIQLWETESQELTMEMFNETPDDYFDNDELALIPSKSPTEVHIMVINDSDQVHVPEDDVETSDKESTDETSFSGQSEEVKGDSDESEGEEDVFDGQTSPNPVNALITFFEDTPETEAYPEADNFTQVPAPQTPPPHPRVATPPLPPPPPPPPPADNGLVVEDKEFPVPPAVAKPVVFKNKEGETVDVVILSTEL